MFGWWTRRRINRLISKLSSGSEEAICELRSRRHASSHAIEGLAAILCSPPEHPHSHEFAASVLMSWFDEQTALLHVFRNAGGQQQVPAGLTPFSTEALAAAFPHVTDPPLRAVLLRAILGRQWYLQKAAVESAKDEFLIEVLTEFLLEPGGLPLETGLVSGA